MERILTAAILAPSAKNRQPWKFIIITNKEKPAMIKAMQVGIVLEKEHKGLISNSLHFISGAENTLKIMEQAPVTVFIFNTQGNYLWGESSVENKLFDAANVQSIGAAIENMILAATDLGIGSLWICDVFFAYRNICEWLNEKNQLIAAVSFGYSAESPASRPRKDINDIVVWR